MKITWSIIFAVAIVTMCSFAFSARAGTAMIKLPYTKGQSFVVVQGYNTLPTHIGKDSYALDFSQNGCDAYAKPVVAASGGIATMVNEQGYSGGYGTELIIDHANNLISRYAHMIPGSIPVGVQAGTKDRCGGRHRFGCWLGLPGASGYPPPFCNGYPK
jgi:hypothetical protein